MNYPLLLVCNDMQFHASTMGLCLCPRKGKKLCACACVHICLLLCQVYNLAMLSCPGVYSLSPSLHVWVCRVLLVLDYYYYYIF